MITNTKLQSFDLLITLKDDTFLDAMDAQNEYQAEQLAYYNWEYATNIVVLPNKKEATIWTG